MKTLLSAVKAAGAGTPIRLTSPQSNHGVQVNFSGLGTITTVVVALEGSISGSTYASIGSLTCTTSTADKIFFVSEKMVEQVRANVTTYASGTYATGTLTSDGNTPASGETIAIDGKTYKFQTASLATEGFVIIGATYAEALVHLISAINDNGSALDYNCAAPHDSVSATLATASQMIATALDYGTASNSIVLAGSGATLAWSAGTLLLGTEQAEVSVHYTPYPSFQ